MVVLGKDADAGGFDFGLRENVMLVIGYEWLPDVASALIEA